MDYYQLLQAESSASAPELRAAYLERARQFHPDQHAGADEATRQEAELRMRAINKAWDTLRNPDTRAAYDESQGFDLLREPEVDPAADAAWSPYDEDDDDPMPAEDIAAPGTGKSQPGWLAVAPMALFGAAAFIFVVGAILSLLPLLFLAAVCFLAAIGLFLLLPVVAMSKSRSADRG